MKYKSWYEGLLSGLIDVGGDLNLYTHTWPQNIYKMIPLHDKSHIAGEVKIFHELLKEGLNKC